VEGAQGTDFLIAVASDGAGSAIYSDIGAAAACRELIACLETYLRQGREWPIPRDFFVERISGLQDLFHEFAIDSDVTAREFACTLLLTVAGETGSTFLQIGDGAIVYAGRDMPGRYAAAFWPERGEYANQTTFITSPNALASLQYEFTDELVEEIAVFTDGIQSLVLDYKAQTAHAPWFDRMFSAVREVPTRGHSSALSEKLRALLDSREINERTDDDKTLILATRRALESRGDNS
jgi:hypothetical protein